MWEEELSPKEKDILKESLDFRKEWKIDEISEWTPPEVLKKYFPIGFAGCDKEGAPVIIISVGNMDIRGLISSSSNENIIKYNIQVFEKVLEIWRTKSRDLEKPIRRGVFILDLEHFSLGDFTWKPALNLMLKGTKIYEANYPEVMKYTFVINAPKTHTVVYNIAKPFLHANTIKRIKIYGKKGWKEDLLKEIDVDQLPVHWGGTMTDPDGNTKCASNAKTQDHPYHCFESSICLLKIHLMRCGWEFRSTGSDIGYEISRIISEEEESLIPFQRINSQIFKEEGVLCCDEKGLYKIIFKNEYSDKNVEVYYTIGLKSLEK
ncbi:SEC14-like protein 2 [Armadillidium vulgare]|nr:SEC14-like protein 2 [Armadillidium vulgare]